MKVLMINGSPGKSECTLTVFSETTKELHKRRVDSEIMQVGTDGVRGCIGCGACKDRHNYVFIEDTANEYVAKMKETDGLIMGLSVYYASANEGVISLLDRIFYMGGSRFAGKPAATIVSVRRVGTTATIDEINKYFTISQVPVVSSIYWNMVHGNCVEDVLRDKEGLQTMRSLARNMA